jgi:hypothetical protein
MKRGQLRVKSEERKLQGERREDATAISLRVWASWRDFSVSHPCVSVPIRGSNPFLRICQKRTCHHFFDDLSLGKSGSAGGEASLAPLRTA